MKFAFAARNNSGFTLVELLMVVSIIAILSGFLIPGFSNYIDSQNLLQGMELVKSDLRTAQNKALTGVGSATGAAFWGVKITGNNASDYLFFNSQGSSSDDCNNVSQASPGAQTSENLPGGVVVRDAAGVCVFFSVRNGDATMVNNGGSDTLQVAYPDDEACYGVQINSAGMIRGVALCE